MNSMPEAVFLDRDGVINEESDYLHDPKDLRLLPGAAEAIKRLNEGGIPVIVMSNQSGVARGLYPESHVGVLHEALAQDLKKEGAHIDRFYYCPHHPTAGRGKYKIICDCRKPMPGLPHQAAKDMSLNLKNCVMVGDKASDLAAGFAAGCRTILVLTGYGFKEWSEWKQLFKPSHISPDLADAVDWMLANAMEDWGKNTVQHI